MASILNRIQELIKEEIASPYIATHYVMLLIKVSKPHSYDNEFGQGHYDLKPGDPKLEGTRGEHWSPKWEDIIKRYRMYPSGEPINPEELPEDVWVEIQTPVDRETREQRVVWILDPLLISREKFEINGAIVDPGMDFLCIAGDKDGPNLDWGCWPVNRGGLADRYEMF